MGGLPPDKILASLHYKEIDRVLDYVIC
jgi:hypothetical protein